MKTYLFQSCGHCWVFQICWHIECSTFTASSFRIWNSSTGIPSPPLALFVVMLPKAHLTSHFRMSGSRWVITQLQLSGSWSFLDSSVYSCHLFVISFASARSIQFLSFVEPIFARNAPLVSLIFLKRSLVFPILLFSSISLHWLLRKAFLSLLTILWNSAFKWVYLSVLIKINEKIIITRWNLHINEYIFPFLLCLYLLFFSQLSVRPPQTTILPFCIFCSWGWSWSLPPVQCHKPLSIILQAYSQLRSKTVMICFPVSVFCGLFFFTENKFFFSFYSPFVAKIFRSLSLCVCVWFWFKCPPKHSAIAFLSARKLRCASLRKCVCWVT